MIYRYRKNGGQVDTVSADNTAFDSMDRTFFDTIIDPNTPDGIDLGISKKWDGTNLRNATANEITAFATAIVTDTNLQNRAAAIFMLQTNVTQRKILRSIVGLMVQQLNILRTNAGLGTITQQQAETAIVNAINAGTFD